MNNELSMILDLLNKLIEENNENNEKINLNNIDLKQLFSVAISQELGSLLFPIIKRYYPQNEKSIIFQKWENDFKKRILINIYLIKQISSIYNVLLDNGLSPIIIKGLSISRFYKNSHYRPVGDLDILVCSSEWDKAIQILLEHGYTEINNDSPLHLEFIKKNSIMIELHRQLIHSGYLGERNTNEWYSHIWEKKQEIDLNGLKFYAMCNEDEIINQIIHFATHFVYYGTKLSHIYEISLIIKINEKNIDWNYIKHILQQTGFLAFAKLILAICKTYFYVKVPVDLVDVKSKYQKKFVNDLFEYFSSEKYIGYYKGWTNILSNYRYIFNNKLLWPIIFIIELKSQYKLHGIKISTILLNTYRNIIMIQKKLDTIRKYSLING